MKQFYPISEKIVSFPVERCSNFPLKEKDCKDAGLPVSWCGVRGCKFRYFSTNPFHKWTPFFCKHKRTDYLISCIALHQILSGASFLQMNARTIGNKYSESNCDKKYIFAIFAELMPWGSLHAMDLQATSLQSHFTRWVWADAHCRDVQGWSVGQWAELGDLLASLRYTTDPCSDASRLITYHVLIIVVARPTTRNCIGLPGHWCAYRAWNLQCLSQ